MSMSAYHGLDSCMESTASAVAPRGASVGPEYSDDDALDGVMQYDQALKAFTGGAHFCDLRGFEPFAGDYRRLHAVADKDAKISVLEHQRDQTQRHAALLAADLGVTRELLSRSEHNHLPALDGLNNGLCEVAALLPWLDKRMRGRLPFKRSRLRSAAKFAAAQ